MKAARMHEYGKALVLEDVPVSSIKPDEILVQVRACGMCRSNMQLVDGYFRQYADLPMPVTPGHEITGVVHKVGAIVPGSAGFREGTTWSSRPDGGMAPAGTVRSAIRTFVPT